MDPTRPGWLRALAAWLVALGLLVTGSAVAQEEERGRDDPPGEDAGEGDDEPGGKRRQRDAEDEVECDPDADPVDQPDECLPPPRCPQGQVDLAPNAEEPSCIDSGRLTRLLADFEAAAADEARALADLGVALDQLRQLNDQLDDLKLRVGEVQIRLAAARADAGFARIREATAGESLDDVAATLADEERRLREQAVEAYMGGDDVELATSAAILEIDNYTELETAREYATVVIDDQLTTVEDVEALRDAVEALSELVAEIEADAAADADRVGEIEAQVDELLVQQRRLVKEAEAEAEAIAEKIAEIQLRKQAYAEQLRVSGVGGGAIGELLRIRQTDQMPPDSVDRLLDMPLLSTRLGSPFGPRVHPIFKDTRLHAGIDMSGNSGDQILSAADGVVVYAESTQGYGNVVVVDHGNTIATLYAHMTADAVFVGQEVLQGDLLGFVGSTGYSTGPHLHFEVRLSGQPVDPMPFLAL